MTSPYPAANSEPPDPELAVVIPAAGRGQRMRSAIPKVLHHLAGRPMLLYVLDAARAVSARPPIVVVSPSQPDVGELARAEGAVTVEQPEPRGTADALARAREAAGGAARVLVLYGDVPLVTAADVRAFLEEARRSPVALVSAELEDPAGYGRVVRHHDGSLLRVVEEPEAGPEDVAIHEVNTGVCCFEADALWRSLPRIAESPGGERYLTSIFELYGSESGLHRAARPHSFTGINDREQLAVAESEIKRRLNAEAMQRGVTMEDPSTVRLDFGVEIGADTVLRPFTLLRGRTRIGSGCEIGPFVQAVDAHVEDGARVTGSFLHACHIGPDAQVGPFSRLRPGARLERGVRVGSFSEIKESHIGEGSAVPHLAYVGDATVGAGVNIGAGTITVNYDGRPGKHRTEIGDGAFIGSDSVLIAPVTIARGAYVAAGSVITTNVSEDSLAVGRARQREIPGWARRRRSEGR